MDSLTTITQLMKNGLIYGTIAGILYLLWVILGSGTFPYLVFGSLPVIAFTAVLSIIFMILACQKEKALLDGSIQFGEAFLVCLSVYFAFNLIYGIGFKFFIDYTPSAMASFLEVSKTSTADLLRKLGKNEDEIFQAVESMEKSILSMFSWKTTILNLIIGVIFPGALYALITAGITSKFSKKQA